MALGLTRVTDREPLQRIGSTLRKFELDPDLILRMTSLRDVIEAAGASPALEDALRIADTGIKWTRDLMFQVMGLTASGLALLYVMIATFRRNVRLPKKRIEPTGI